MLLWLCLWLVEVLGSTAAWLIHRWLVHAPLRCRRLEDTTTAEILLVLLRIELLLLVLILAVRIVAHLLRRHVILLLLGVLVVVVMVCDVVMGRHRSWQWARVKGRCRNTGPRCMNWGTLVHVLVV